MVLVGSVQRSELSRVLYECLSLDRYLLFISKRLNHHESGSNASPISTIVESAPNSGSLSNFLRGSFRGSTETLDSRIAVRPRRESGVTLGGHEAGVSRRVSMASRRDSVLLFTGNGVERVVGDVIVESHK